MPDHTDPLVRPTRATRTALAAAAVALAVGGCSWIPEIEEADDGPSVTAPVAELVVDLDEGVSARFLGDPPETAVVREFLTALDAGDVDAVYRRLSTPARVAVGFRDGLDLEALAAELPDAGAESELTLVEDVVPGIDVVLLEGGGALIVRSEIGELLVEPLSPLTTDGDGPGPQTVVLPVEGADVNVAVDPVRGAAVVEGGASVSSGPQILLSEGDRGTEVSEWQRLLATELAERGLRGVTVDGIYGPGTAAGTARLEEALGLEADGALDTDLLAALEE